MLKVSINVQGFEFYNIAEMLITNNGTGTTELGNYDVVLKSEDKSITCNNFIENFERLDNDAFELLRLILNKLNEKDQKNERKNIKTFKKNFRNIWKSGRTIKQKKIQGIEELVEFFNETAKKYGTFKNAKK